MRVHDINIRSYTEAMTYLNGKVYRPLAHNTGIMLDGYEPVIRYHATDIVRYHRDGRITLDCGGWMTPTTKARMNRLIPPRYFVYTYRNELYLADSNHWESAGNDYPFDGNALTFMPGKGQQRPTITRHAA